MNFAGRLQTSWELMKSSLAVMRRHPRLVLFPLVSGISTIALMLFFLAPIVWLIVSEVWMNQPDWFVVGKNLQRFGKEEAVAEFMRGLAGGFYAYGALIYLVSLVTAGFFNVAFYHEILRGLAGETVSLRRGLRFATTRLSAILRWSLLAGTVGLVIRLIEEKLGWVGRMVMGFVGAAWSVAAVFVIPVIVRRTDADPFVALRDSAATLKRTWGESVTGYIGIQIVGALSVAGLTILAVAAAFGAGALRQGWLMLGVGAAWLLGLIAVGVFFSMATHIYRCALYVYASEGVIPGPYTAELMNAGWKVKKR